MPDPAPAGGGAQDRFREGSAHQQAGRLLAALAGYDAALALKPDFAQVWNNRGNVLADLNRLDEAVESYRQSLVHKPDHVNAWIGLGRAQRLQGRVLDFLTSMQSAVAAHPGHVQAWDSLGVAHMELMHWDEAQSAFEQASSLDGNGATARFHLAQLLLLQGRFREAWPLYESRWQGPMEKQIRRLPVPQWQGQVPLSGKSILLHAEQGLGDTIQFSRYAQQVKALGAARVVLEVQAPLKPLLQGLPGVDALLARGEHVHPVDLHCPLMSLPLAFQTDATCIPQQVPALQAPMELKRRWSALMGPSRGARVGLVWSGSAGHAGDQWRSLPLDAMLEMLPDQLDAVSVQPEVRPTDQDALRQAAESGRLRHLGERLTDFAQTAALLEHVDLLVSVDTSVAHLAAAMGKPTWILLPHVPDWRWMCGRDDSPWYPSVRLFRQGADKRWGPTLDRVREALIAWQQDFSAKKGH
jgi:Flp pilus assembly protein TadD